MCIVADKEEPVECGDVIPTTTWKKTLEFGTNPAIVGRDNTDNSDNQEEEECGTVNKWEKSNY